MSAYRIELTADDDGTFLVTSPDLPEVTTFGATEAEAIGFAELAVEEALAARIAAGLELPPPTGFVTVGKPYVILRAQTAIKIALYKTLRQCGLTRAELARRLGWHREQVDRLFRLDHASKLDQMEAAFMALGFRIDLSKVVEAA
jgi:antitoxin HicB